MTSSPEGVRLRWDEAEIKSIDVNLYSIVSRYVMTTMNVADHNMFSYLRNFYLTGNATYTFTWFCNATKWKSSFILNFSTEELHQTLNKERNIITKHVISVWFIDFSTYFQHLERFAKVYHSPPTHTYIYIYIYIYIFIYIYLWILKVHYIHHTIFTFNCE